MLGLNVTGVLDKETIAKINSPRCIKPDFPPSDKIASYKTASKWKKFDLTYRILNENEELKGQTRRIIGEAFKYWSDVSSLSFIEVHPSQKADLTVEFFRKDHGDGYPFDGKSGVLAHAFFPEVGDIHFDEDEVFTDQEKDGSDLKLIAIHELGHALGLEHSLVPGAIMNPYYKGYEENFKLSKDDVGGIQFLYGNKAPTTTSTTSTISTTSTTTTTKKTTTTTTRRISLSTATTTTTTTRRISLSTATTTTTTPRRISLSTATSTTTTQRTTTKITTTFTTTTIRSTAKPTTTKLTLTTSTSKLTTKALIHPNTTINNSAKVNTTTRNPFLSMWPCVAPKRAVFLSPNKTSFNVLVEEETIIFNYDMKTKIWKKEKLRSLYKNLPVRARGGVMDNNGVTWFFNDRDVFAYRGTYLIEGYPRKVRDLFYSRHPTAATIKNNKIYIFKNWLIYEFDVQSLTIKSIHRVNTIFPGLPYEIDAAVRFNGFYYFFNDEFVYKFDEKQNKVVDKYPKNTLDGWFPCSV